MTYAQPGQEGSVVSFKSRYDNFIGGAFVPPVAGTYKVIASARDSRGNVVRSSAFLWVSGQQYVSWRQQNSNRVDLITDRDDPEPEEEPEDEE